MKTNELPSTRHIPNPAIKAEVEQDLADLAMLEQYQLTEKQREFLTHQFNREHGRGLPVILNFINGRTGSAILHYRNRYVDGQDIPDFNADK